MPLVNIGPGRLVEMTQEEAQAYWGPQRILPERFGGGSATPAQLPVKRLANGKQVTNEYEAYWASQPAEMQRLMYAQDEQTRWWMAHDLADRGFLIDVPIMVWGWDPLSTMIVRRNQGYSWVPSANQHPVPVAPGVNFPGLPPYDPNNPPAGSIKVTTEWARGFEHTSPWPIDPEDLAKI